MKIYNLLNLAKTIIINPSSYIFIRYVRMDTNKGNTDNLSTQHSSKYTEIFLKETTFQTTLTKMLRRIYSSEVFNI